MAAYLASLAPPVFADTEPLNVSVVDEKPTISIAVALNTTTLARPRNIEAVLEARRDLAFGGLKEMPAEDASKQKLATTRAGRIALLIRSGNWTGYQQELDACGDQANDVHRRCVQLLAQHDQAMLPEEVLDLATVNLPAMESSMTDPEAPEVVAIPTTIEPPEFPIDADPGDLPVAVRSTASRVLTGAVATLVIPPRAVASRLATRRSVETTAASAYESAAAPSNIDPLLRSYATLLKKAATRGSTRTLLQRLEAGVGLREDVLGAQAKEAAAERDLTIAHANAQIASVRLLEFLVLSDEIGSGSILVPDSILMSQSPHVRNHPVPGPLQFPLQDLTANELIERGLQQRPDLMAARAEVRASRSLSRASSAWGHPIVSARTGVGRFGAESGDLDDQETAEVGIGWQFGLDSGASHRRAIAIFEETQLAMKKLELRISAQIRESLARLTASRASMASANRQLEASEETLILVRLRYQAGAALLDELLGREADLSEARTGWLNSILSHNQAQFDLMLAIGGP
jgi:hypothetical protein